MLQIIMFAKVDNSLKLLNYISFVSVCTALLISFFIPRIKFKSDKQQPSVDHGGFFAKIYINLRQSFSDPFIIKWSIWWAVSTCVYSQVGNYIQIVWSQIGVGENDSQTYNGLVEALNSLLCKVDIFNAHFVSHIVTRIVSSGHCFQALLLRYLYNLSD